VLRFWNFDRKQRLLDKEEALAFRPQSIVGDMIKVVGRRLYNMLDSRHRLVTTTHDSWTVSAVGGFEDLVAKSVKVQMEAPWPELGGLACPADISVGKCWGKYHATKCKEGLRKWVA
jgi:hypothetical protein